MWHSTPEPTSDASAHGRRFFSTKYYNRNTSRVFNERARLGGARSESGGAGGACGADTWSGERGDGERRRGRGEQDAAEEREAQEEGEEAAVELDV